MCQAVVPTTWWLLNVGIVQWCCPWISVPSISRHALSQTTRCKKPAALTFNNCNSKLRHAMIIWIYQQDFYRNKSCWYIIFLFTYNKLITGHHIFSGQKHIVVYYMDVCLQVVQNRGFQYNNFGSYEQASSRNLRTPPMYPVSNNLPQVPPIRRMSSHDLPEHRKFNFSSASLSMLITS